MGLFGGGSTNITVNIPEVKVPTAQELFSQGLSQAQEISPLALGAREEGLSNIGQLTPTPEDFSAFGSTELGELSPDFFSQFQPTSFEQGISGSFFEDALDKARRTASLQASLSGISSGFDERFSRAISPTLFNIGQFLSNQGQRRGELALGRQSENAQRNQRQSELGIAGRQQGILSQLGISPQEEIAPFIQLGQQQGNLQAQLQQQNALVQAQTDLANQLKAQQPSGFGRILGSAIGGIGGAFLGGPAGAIQGIGLGGGLGSLAGGTFGAGDALGIFGGLGGFGDNNLFGTQAQQSGISGAGIGGVGGVGGNQSLSNLLPLNPDIGF